ncbi:unnamed protein product [Amoebophrya sp. A25]|nr:unnamed protein product [Amoebophrya sp. A25]|eukprot:GSA25T00017563001.1
MNVPHRISFIGFGRVEDMQLLMTFSTRNRGPAWDDPRMPTIKKLLKAAKTKMSAGQRQKLVWEGSQVFVQLDFPQGGLLYVVICKKASEADEDYPERIAYALLSEVMQHVETNYAVELQQRNPGDVFSNDMADWLLERADAFDDPDEYDKLARVKLKADAVKGVMKNNINAMLKNTENLNVLEEQALDMAEEAKDYDEEAEEIKDYFWWKDCKVTLLIGALVIVMTALMIFCCCREYMKKPEDGGSKKE